MTPYGKVAQTAVAAITRLAEVFDAEMPVRLSSGDVAKSRNLPQPVVAKVLVTLSQAGLVSGAPGPGGGYALARPPGEIRLAEVAKLFGQQDDQLSCPFGPDWCGNGPRCPLHDELIAVRERIEQFLERNTLEPFASRGDDAAT